LSHARSFWSIYSPTMACRIKAATPFFDYWAIVSANG
jgi:hypothetical protein